MHISSEFVDFSTSPHCTVLSFQYIGLSATPANCHHWTLFVVMDVIERLSTDRTFKELKKFKWDLGRVVSDEISEITKDSFTWETVSQIIFASRKSGISINTLEAWYEKFPLSLRYLGFKNPYSSEHVNLNVHVRNLAKAVLWVEVMSFLLLKGYDKLLEQ